MYGLGVQILLLVPLVIAWRCFRGVYEVLSEAEKHKPFTSLDHHLPLRGRWLSYATAAFLVVVGIAAVILDWWLWAASLPVS